MNRHPMRLRRVLRSVVVGIALVVTPLPAHAISIAAPQSAIARADKVLGTLQPSAVADPTQSMRIQIFLKPRSSAAWQSFLAYSHRPGFVPMTTADMRAAVSPTPRAWCGTCPPTGCVSTTTSRRR